MFITFSKTIGKIGGVRFGIGKRVKAENAWWIALLLLFVYIFQLLWYGTIAAFWLIYAMFYGMWWCCKKLFQLVKMIYTMLKNKIVEMRKDRISESEINPYLGKKMN